MKKDCSNCEHLGRDCPKMLLLLHLDELIDWCLYIMAQYKLTHDYVARISNVPKGTLDRILAKQSADCRYSTIHAIVCALFDYLGLSTVCVDEVAAAAVVQDDTLRQQNAELQMALDADEKELAVLRRQVAEFDSRRDFLRSQIEKKDARIDALSNTVGYWRRVVRVLSILLGLSVVIIIAALVVDGLSPNIGYFWR